MAPTVSCPDGWPSSSTTSTVCWSSRASCSRSIPGGSCIVRLAGTNVEEGRRIITESGLPIITADDLGEAAEKAVAAASKSGT